MAAHAANHKKAEPKETSPAPLAVSPAPHPPAVFRLLKQAWRTYLATGGGLQVTVANPAGQAHTAPTTVTGTVLADASVPAPVLVLVSLKQGTTTAASQTVSAVPGTGAYTATFAANTLVAGSATATAASPIIPVASAVTSTAFTVT